MKEKNKSTHGEQTTSADPSLIMNMNSHNELATNQSSRLKMALQWRCIMHWTMLGMTLFKCQQKRWDIKQGPNCSSFWNNFVFFKIKENRKQCENMFCILTSSCSCHQSLYSKNIISHVCVCKNNNNNKNLWSCFHFQKTPFGEEWDI